MKNNLKALTHSEWQKEKYYSDMHFRLKRKIANAIRKALKGDEYFMGTLSWLEYDIEDLKIKLEAEYEGEVDWSNLGKTLDIDHRIADSWFKYEDESDKEFLFAWSMENLQLMDRISNREKKNVFADPSIKQLENPLIREVLKRNNYVFDK